MLGVLFAIVFMCVSWLMFVLLSDGLQVPNDSLGYWAKEFEQPNNHPETKNLPEFRKKRIKLPFPKKKTEEETKNLLHQRPPQRTPRERECLQQPMEQKSISIGSNGLKPQTGTTGGVLVDFSKGFQRFWFIFSNLPPGFVGYLVFLTHSHLFFLWMDVFFWINNWFVDLFC